MAKLGQHFLKSKKIIDEIIKAAEIGKNDTVLEAGSGKGILTEALIQHAGRVITVEKDKNLVELLKKNFEQEKNLEIIYGDILKIRNYKVKNYKIVANIPYYITSRFLRIFLENENQPKLMVLMIQKEVAERIVAKDGKESLLSISVRAYGLPKIIKKVPARYFSPVPKVDSAIIKIEKISKNFFKGTNEKDFFALVKKGFSSKRKMLKNNLKISTRLLNRCVINEKARAENLSLNDWKCLLLNHSRKYPSSDPK